MEISSIFPSWLLSAFVCLCLSFILIHTLRWKRSSKVVPYRLPPSPPQLPIIGNFQLLGNHRHRTMWQLSQKYGPVMLLRFGKRSFLIVSSSTTAKEVMNTHDHAFYSRPFSHSTKRISYDYLGFAFAPYDNHWRKMRKILASEFLGIRRASLFNQVAETEMEGLIRSLSLHPARTSVSLDKKLLTLMYGVMGKVGYGKSCREEPFKGTTVKEMIEEIMTLLGGSFRDSFPIFGWILDKLSGWDGRVDKCFSSLDEYFQRILDEHIDQTASDEASDHEKDFVDVLLELSSKKKNCESPLTKDEIKALMLDLFVGAFDTTVVTTVWAVSEIVRNPRVMQKLQNEIRNCIGRKPKICVSDTKHMTYLKMVVKETLRLHPVAPMLLPRECISHCQIGGYDVLPGTIVLINAWGIGRDPNTWGENPTEFYPERFEEVEIDFGGKHFEMVPFGAGRRGCPGINVGIASVEFNIANLLYWFDWKVPAAMNNEDLNMEEDGSLVVKRKTPLDLVPIKHNWQDQLEE